MVTPDKPIVLIDVSNLAWRSHFAFSQLSSHGQPTGVLYGFLSAVLRLRKGYSKHMLFCWDNGVPVIGGTQAVRSNWRREVFAEYKANREHKQDDFNAVMGQLSEMAVVLDMLGYGNCSIGIPGLEADDVISIASHQYAKYPQIIYSSDCDLYQLLTNDFVRIHVSSKKNGTNPLLTRTAVEKEFGFSIEHWAKYLAMGGDKSDNIKPKQGMGPKTAATLVKEGADPLRPYNVQPDSVKKRLDEDTWQRVQAAYRVARLPTRWHELPKHYVPNPLPKLSCNQTRGDVQTFTQWCAKREMHDLFANRRNFFN